MLLLGVLAVGLACYAGWRLLENASSGPDRRHQAPLVALVVAVIYAGLCVRAAELAAGHPTSGSASSNPEPWVAKVMRWSGGSVAIAMVGGGILIGAGLGLAAWGILHRYEKDLRPGDRFEHRMADRVVKVLGGLGDLARGALLRSDRCLPHRSGRDVGSGTSQEY